MDERLERNKRFVAEFYGLIDEHWDVIQEIPADSVNPNSLF